MAECHLTHGLARKGQHHPLYGIWEMIKVRCYCKTAWNYRYYGAKGVAMCDRWHYDAGEFVKWCLSNGWKPGLEIDRFPDNAGPYSPDNCRFVTHKENCRNKRNNVLLTAFGETRTFAEWLEDSRCVVHEGGLRHRLFIKHMSLESALVSPHTHSHLATRKPRFQLTLEDEQVIRAELLGGTPQNVLAKRFKQSTSRMNRIAKRLRSELTAETITE